MKLLLKNPEKKLKIKPSQSVFQLVEGYDATVFKHEVLKVNAYPPRILFMPLKVKVERKRDRLPLVCGIMDSSHYIEGGSFCK